MKRKNDMKTIKVVAAVIRDRDKIFATQRGYGEFKGGYGLSCYHPCSYISIWRIQRWMGISRWKN